MDRDQTAALPGDRLANSATPASAPKCSSAPRKNFGKQVAYADKRNSPAVIIEGTQEREQGIVQIKDLIAGKRSRQGDHRQRRMEGRTARPVRVHATTRSSRRSPRCRPSPPGWREPKVSRAARRGSGAPGRVARRHPRHAAAAAARRSLLRSRRRGVRPPPAADHRQQRRRVLPPSRFHAADRRPPISTTADRRARRLHLSRPHLPPARRRSRPNSTRPASNCSAQPDADAALDQVLRPSPAGALAIFGINAPKIRLGGVGLFEALLAGADMPAAWRPRIRHRFGHPEAMERLLDAPRDPRRDAPRQQAPEPRGADRDRHRADARGRPQPRRRPHARRDRRPLSRAAGARRRRMSRRRRSRCCATISRSPARRCSRSIDRRAARRTAPASISTRRSSSAHSRRHLAALRPTAAVSFDAASRRASTTTPASSSR